MMRIAVIASMFAMSALPCLAADKELTPELKVLDQRVGTWKTETVTKPGAWVPEGAKSSGVETIEWTLGRKFIKGEAKVQGPRGKNTNLHLMTFDPHERVYRFWFFDSEGNFPRSDMAGTYDENTKTIIFKQSLPNDDVSSVVSMKFTSKDRVDWHGQWKDKDGQVMMEIEGVVTRVQEKQDGK